MAPRVFHNCRRSVEAHRLIVNQTRVKLRRTMRFQIGAPIGQNRETNRMRFRKSVKRERRDRMQNFLNHLRRDLIARHRLTQFHAYLVHSLFRTMKAKSTPQFFRFVAGKIRHDHRDLEHLFLKQRHPEGALQHWL